MKIFTRIAFVFFAGALFSSTPVAAQTVGDARSAGSGNWSNNGQTSIWEEYHAAYGGWKLRSEAAVGADSVTMRRPGYDASGWMKAQVPGTIFGAYVAAGIEADPSYGDNIYKVNKAKYNANHWYRTEFAVPKSYAGKRIWLNFVAINKNAEIYINNIKLDLLKGFMKRGQYDITDKVNKTGTNVVAVKVLTMTNQINNQESPTYKSSGGWDWMPEVPGLNRGLHEKVYLSATDDITIHDPWMRTMELQNNNTSAKMLFATQLKNHSTQPQNGTLTIIINPGNTRITQPFSLAAKETKNFAPPAFIMNNVKLWWPNGYGDPNLYNCKLIFEQNGQVSDSTSFNFGIRKYNYHNDKNGVFQLSINGKRVYVKGGNWGIPDFVLNYRDEANYETRIKFHKDMNMNMIRSWTGSTTDEAFYNMCDKYGIMIWDDYWLNNRFTFLNDEKAFLANVPEKLKRFRNHASIAVWCGSNENVPFQDIQLQDSTLKYDGGDRLYQSSSSGQNVLTNNIKVQFGMPKQGGLSGSGPWNNLDLANYFTPSIKRNSSEGAYVGTWGFRSELGAVAFPNAESFKKFIPADKLWPRNEMWDRAHYFDNDWAYGGGASPSDYMNRINRFYGTATGIEDFCKKAQLMNLETHKAMFEGWQDHIWNDASGLLYWMSQTAFPTMIWQTYDYYYDCTGAYYGIKHASEPVHIQWSIADDGVKVVNTTHTTLNNITAKSTVYNIDGSIAEAYSQTQQISALQDTITYCFNALNKFTSLALKKPVTVSSSESNNVAAYAVDGLPNTRWASGALVDNSWIYVDLGFAQSIKTITLQWESAASGYKIQVSNDAVSWTDVYSTTTGDGGTDIINISPVNARYVKMQTVKRAGFFGVSLFDFSVYSGTSTPLSDTHFIKLELTDNTGKLISDNFYWHSTTGNYAGLNSMPNVALDVTASTVTQGDKAIMTIKIKNPVNAAGIAFGLHVQLLNSANNERVLPAIISDNYFSVVKGEEKIITIEYNPVLLSGAQPKLDIKQYSDLPEQQPMGKVISSPDGKINFYLFAKNNRAYYKIDREGMAVIEESPLALSINGKLVTDVAGIDLIKQKVITETYPTRGIHNLATNNCTDAGFSLTGTDNSSFSLQVKVFNNGIAFRYQGAATGTVNITADSTGFTLPAGSVVWSQGDINNYEGVYTRRAVENINKGQLAGPPVTIKLPYNNGYASIAEGGLSNFGGMSLRFAGNRMFRANLQGTNQLNGNITTPWRIVMAGKDLNTLVNSDIISNVSPRPDSTLFPNGVNESWLKPGKSAWSWIANKDIPIFQVSYDNMLHYSQMAGQLGLEYNLVDQGWEYFWANNGKTKWDVLKDLVDKSAALNVKIWVWKSYSPFSFWGDPGLKDSTARREFFAQCKNVGVAGIKLDFFTGENQEITKWQEAALRDAAKLQLMLDMHGTYKPAGQEYTWPNEMTREGIRGLEYGTDNTIWSTHNTIVPFTRFLAGHADYTPFTLRSDVAKGTTLAHQVASVVTFTSPLMVLGVFPDSLANSTVKDVIKAIPSVWDETIVLPPSEIGEIAGYARRSGKFWYLAVLNNETAKSAVINLSFLGTGSWTANEMKEGTATNKVAFSTANYTSGSTVTLALPAGGGYLARFEQ